MDDFLQVCEVGPRDGLQSLGLVLSIEERAAFIRELSAAGLKKQEVGSMVNPRYVPEMQNSGLLYKMLAENSNPEDELILLVPNERGLEDALSVGCRSLAFFSATSESFNQKNIRMSVQESIEVITEMLKGIDNSIHKRLYISTVFHCPYDGIMQEELALEKFSTLFELVDEISLGDTTGKSEPEQVENLAGILAEHAFKDKIWWHFHDTYQRAKANCRTTIKRGFTKYDSSAGGIGGCPFAPGAKGNISTESLLLVAEEEGLNHHIDVARVAKAAEAIKGKL